MIVPNRIEWGYWILRVLWGFLGVSLVLPAFTGVGPDLQLLAYALASLTCFTVATLLGPAMQAKRWMQAQEAEGAINGLDEST